MTTNPAFLIQSAPSSPADGDVWYDSTRKKLALFQGGVIQYVTTAIFTQTNTQTVGNSTAELSLLGTGFGTTVLPANFWVPGKQLRIKGRGFYSAASLAPTLVLKSKFGAAVLASVTISNLLNSASNVGFSFEEILTCRSTGGTGTVQLDGSLGYSTGLGLLGASYLIDLTPSVADTTISQTLDFTAQWASSVNQAACTVSITNASIEVLN